MKKLHRNFSIVFVNQNFKNGLEKLNKKDVLGSMNEFLSAKNDPNIQNDIQSLTKINKYLFICFKYQQNHHLISEILEEQILLYSLKKQPENILIKDFGNLVRSLVESDRLDKAIYYLENYRKILKTKNFSNTFENQMEILLSSIYILFSKFYEVKQICENLLGTVEDPELKGILYNNLALAHFFGSEQYNKDNIFQNFQQGLLCTESSKRIKDEDLPALPKELQKDFQEIIQVDQDQEESEELRSYKKMKTLQEQVENYLKDLEDVLTNQKYTQKSLEKLTYQTKSALIISTNICEYLDKTKEIESSAFFNKLNLKSFQLFSTNIHTKIFFNYYRHHIKQLNLKAAEQILNKAIKIGQKEKSEYFNLSLLHYYQFLEEQQRFYELDLLKQKIIKDLFNNKYKKLDQIKGNIKDFKFEEIIDHKKIKKEFLILPSYEVN